jgi:tetratricopeptide (TPR) repeat protein
MASKGRSSRRRGGKESKEEGQVVSDVEDGDPDLDNVTKKAAALANSEKKMSGQKAAEYFKIGLSKSKKAKNKGEYAEALEAYTMAITLKGSNARYYFARGNTYRVMGENKKAILDYSSAIRLDSGTALYYSNRGQCYRKVGKPTVALGDFEAALALEPGNGTFFFHRGMALYDAGRYNDALKDFTTAIKDRKQTYRAHYNRGNCYRRLLRMDESIDDLNKAIDLEPRNPSGHNNLGLSYFEAKEYDTAIKCFSDAVGIDEDNPTFYNNRGLALYHRGDMKDAISDLNEAIARDNAKSPDPNFYFNRGNARLALKETGRAMSDFVEAARIAPGDARYVHAVGLAHQQAKGEEQQALEHFDRAIELNPDHIPSLYHRGLMLHSLQRLDEAIAIFSEVLEKSGDDRLVYESRGLVWQDLHRHPSAVSDFTTALELDPGQGENHYHRGESLLRLGDLQGAIVDFAKATKLKFTNPLVYNARGMTKRALGHLDEAISDLTDAIQHAPENIEFLLNRSTCFLDVDDPGSAEADMTEALELNARDGRLYQRRGEARLALHMFDEAIEDLLDALRCEPTRRSKVEVHRTLGCSYANSDRHEEAVKYFRLALEGGRLLSVGLGKGEDMDRSKMAWEGVRTEQEEEENDLHELAKSLQMCGEYYEAIENFSFVLAMNPRNAHAHFRRAFAYKSVKEYDRAAEDFEKAKELDPENPHLSVNYRNLYDVECILLCDSGMEPLY